jgi:hypothetical protein
MPVLADFFLLALAFFFGDAATFATAWLVSFTALLAFLLAFLATLATFLTAGLGAAFGLAFIAAIFHHFVESRQIDGGTEIRLAVRWSEIGPLVMPVWLWQRVTVFV